jgi:hypothetical protein
MKALISFLAPSSRGVEGEEGSTASVAVDIATTISSVDIRPESEVGATTSSSWSFAIAVALESTSGPLTTVVIIIISPSAFDSEPTGLIKSL